LAPIPPQDNRVVFTVAERPGEMVEVCDPLGEYQAVPPSPQGCDYVVGDLRGAGIVSHKVAVDGRDPAWRRGVGVSCLAEAGRMHAQDRIEVVGRLCLSIQR
jgi:hypothetical protein